MKDCMEDRIFAAGNKPEVANADKVNALFLLGREIHKENSDQKLIQRLLDVLNP